MRGKFRTQLTLVISFILLATIGLISLLANISINDQFEKYAKEQQNARAADIAANLSRSLDNLSDSDWNTDFIHGVGMAAMYDGYIIRLTDQDGKVIWDAQNHNMKACSQVMMEIMNRMEEKRPGLNGDFSAHEFDLVKDNQKVGTVEIRFYGPYFLSERDFHLLDSLNLVLITIGSLSLICSVIAVGILAKRISDPVIKTAHIAKQIAEGNYQIRFHGKIKTQELDELVTAVNHMAAALDKQESIRKRLTTDVAHELRTPLTAVASHLEMMIEGVWEPTPERMHSCYEEVGRISGLVADMERLSQVENENLQLEKIPLELGELVQQACINFESEAAKKEISIAVKKEAAVVMADKTRMMQVITNLLSNAIKYTGEKGSIQISVKDMPDAGVLVFEDDGAGIPEEELGMIFERFYRTDKSRNRKTGGSGIGLTIAKSIVTAHNGTITAKSIPGKGSCFTVTIPK